MEEKEVKSDSQRIAEGQILVRTILEMLGAPKEHIESTMKGYVDNLKEGKDYEIVKEFISNTKEQKEKKMFSIYAELEIWFKDVDTIIGFCFDSLPSSVEIIEPQQISFKSNGFSGLLNDLQAKLHKLDLAYKTYKTDLQATSAIFETIVKNFIGYCLKTGKNDIDDIAKETGIEKERLQKLLDQLAEKKVIHKKDNNYSL